MQNAAVHRLVEQHSALRGDDIALVGESGTLTYRALNQRANALARYLIDTGLRRASHVVVRMERSPELAIVLLAVLKAGAAYSWVDGRDDGQWQQSLDRSGHMHPNLPILTRGTDIACVLPGRDGMPPVMVPHATMMSLQLHPVAHPTRGSMEPAALDLWLPLMAGTTVTLSSPASHAAVAA